MESHPHKIEHSESWNRFHGLVADVGFGFEKLGGSVEGWLLETCRPQVEWVDIQLTSTAWDRLDFGCDVVASVAIRVDVYVGTVKVHEQMISAKTLTRISFDYIPPSEANESLIKFRFGPIPGEEKLKFLFVDQILGDPASVDSGLRIETSHKLNYKALKYFEFVFYAFLFTGSFILIMENLSFQKDNASLSAVISALVGGAIVLLGRFGVTISSLPAIGRRLIPPIAAKSLTVMGVLLLIPAIAYSGLIIDCVYSSDKYKRDVKNFIFSDDLAFAASAWRLFPRRKEIYMAVNRALAERRIDPIEKKNFAASFINAVSFANRNQERFQVGSVVHGICPCLIGDHEDEIIQLAMIAPDAQGSSIPIGNTKDTRYTLLAQHELNVSAKENIEARLLQYILDSPLVDRGDSFLGFSNYQNYLDGLEEFIQANRRVIGQSHLYQEALSLLGGRALTLCFSRNPKFPGNQVLESSLGHYERLIGAREATYSRNPRWTRPPNKMTFHALIMSLYGIPTSREQDWTEPLMSKECSALKVSLEKKFGNSRYATWYSQEAWTRGTIYHPNVRGQEGFWEFIENSLNTGWKY